MVKKGGLGSFYTRHHFSSEDTAEDYQENLITYIRVHYLFLLSHYLERNPRLAYVELWCHCGFKGYAPYASKQWASRGSDSKGTETVGEWVDVTERLAA